MWMFQLNAGTVSFCRVIYPPEMLEEMIPAIKDLSMPPKDRLGLQSDLFALVSPNLTLRKIAIWLSKNCQKLDIFF